MANITVNIKELRQVLDSTPASHNIMLVGKHGIGKSEILTQYFSEKGIPVISLFLGQMADPGDLIGLPHKNSKTGKTEFMPPYWFPVDGKPVVLFLDELNRARPEILQTVMDLCLNRKLAGRSLPEGSRVISAVNDGEQYTLTSLDPALVSRFNVLNFRPEKDEFLLWCQKNDVDSRVIDFINEAPQWLDGNPDSREGADTGLDKTPDRRSWKRVSDIIKGQDELAPIMKKLISSAVGARAASAFLTSLSEKRIITARELLFNFENVVGKIEAYQIHQLSVLNESIYRFLEVEKVSEGDKKKAAKNLNAYFDLLAAKKKEGAAHFATLYTSETYPHAIKFMANNCSVLVMAMVMYVKGI